MYMAYDVYQHHKQKQKNWLITVIGMTIQHQPKCQGRDSSSSDDSPVSCPAAYMPVELWCSEKHQSACRFWTVPHLAVPA